ncbi:MAG: general secretion pathway protein GspB [Pseudomonadota bacterium]
MSLILSALQKLETASGGNEDAPIWRTPIESRENRRAFRHRSGRRAGAALLSTLAVTCFGIAGYILAGYWEGRGIDEKRAVHGDLKPVATVARPSTPIVNRADSMTANFDASNSQEKKAVKTTEGEEGQTSEMKPPQAMKASRKAHISAVRSVPKPAGTEKVSKRPSMPDKSAMNRIVPFPSPALSPDRAELTAAGEPLPVAEGLTLMAVSWSDHPENRLAVINGRIIREGGRIEGHDVLQIAAEQVVLGSNGRRLSIGFIKRSPGE